MERSARSPSHSPSWTPSYASQTDRWPNRHANIFQPPRSPSTTAATDRRHHSIQTPRYAAGTASSRKRARPESDRTSVVTPNSSATRTLRTNVQTTESSILRSDCASPPPLVNTTYNIAGGLDTPSQTVESYFDPSEYSDLGVTRRRKAASHANVNDDESTKTSIDYPGILLGGVRNGQARFVSSPNGASRQGWGDFVFTMVGGVAGKVWQFCKAGAFTGFHAGGGAGYNMEQSNDVRLRDSSAWEDEDETQRNDRALTPVPGQYPEEDDFDSRPRPAKRQQIDCGSGWVMVSETPWYTSPAPTSRLPLRRTTASETPRSLRLSPGHRRSFVPAPRRASDIPSGARPVMTPHRRSTLNVASVASSPLSPEALRLLSDRRRGERQASASIQRLNAQLRAMIKEGREALGTKVEVVDDGSMEDEGYCDEK